MLLDAAVFNPHKKFRRLTGCHSAALQMELVAPML